MTTNYYKVWEWYDTPYHVRSLCSWKKGTWVIQLTKQNGNFTRQELDKCKIINHPDWETEFYQIDDIWYMFVNDPKEVTWPPFVPDDDMFGAQNVYEKA